MELPFLQTSYRIFSLELDSILILDIFSMKRFGASCCFNNDYTTSNDNDDNSTGIKRYYTS